MEEVILTEKELRALCAEYQKILRLQDWRNLVRVVRQYDFDKKDVEGQVRYTLGRKEALIYVLDSTDYQPTQAFPQDMEVTLVHELLHLHFAEVSDRCEDAEVDIHTSLEQAVQSLAEAIVALRRVAGQPSQGHLDNHNPGQEPKEAES